MSETLQTPIAGSAKSGDNRKSWFVEKALVPVITAVLAAAGGAYVTSAMSKANASERAISNSITINTVAQEAIQSAKAAGSPPELLTKLNEIQGLAREVEADAVALEAKEEHIELKADIILRTGQAGRIGDGSATLGVTGPSGDQDVRVRFKGSSGSMEPGETTDSYTGADGGSYHIVYTGRVPGTELFGFQEVSDRK
jgi:hypothetical protein